MVFPAVKSVLRADINLLILQLMIPKVAFLDIKFVSYQLSYFFNVCDLL